MKPALWKTMRKGALYKKTADLCFFLRGCFRVEYIEYSMIIFQQLINVSARLEVEEIALSENVMDRSSQKWAAICHLSALVGLLGNGIGFFLAPLIVWLVKRQDNPFIDEQGKEAVNFQITMLLAAAVSALLMLVLVGFILIAIVGILMVVFPIIAAVKASEGKHYRYPISLRLIT
jgi:uncharacterized Tic20 family protein